MRPSPCSSRCRLDTFRGIERAMIEVGRAPMTSTDTDNSCKRWANLRSARPHCWPGGAPKPADPSTVLKRTRPTATLIWNESRSVHALRRQIAALKVARRGVPRCLPASYPRRALPHRRAGGGAVSAASAHAPLSLAGSHRARQGAVHHRHALPDPYPGYAYIYLPGWLPREPCAHQRGSFCARQQSDAPRQVLAALSASRKVRTWALVSVPALLVICKGSLSTS